jgi:hypothetical protein
MTIARISKPTRVPGQMNQPPLFDHPTTMQEEVEMAPTSRRARLNTRFILILHDYATGI